MFSTETNTYKNMFEIYQQIINLRESKNPKERGYQFEQLIREIQPWQFKPPVVMSPKSEQLDGVYTRNGITFIIESKAKIKKITQGNKDWEDFELKIRRRHGNGIIGIYCSLYDVHENVFEAGNRLNNEGIFNFILAGDIWEQLLNCQLDFGNLVDYMVQYIRAKNISKPPKIKNIFEWVYNNEEVSRKITDFSQKESGVFLRRFKHKQHEKLYVKRSLDLSIQHIVNLLKPNSLKNKQAGMKEIPKQFIIIRDLSGSGKTTLAVELSLSFKDFVVIGLSANQTSIDEKIDVFLNHFKNHGLNELKTINSPIVFVIDSLDEVSNIREKKNEIKALFNRIEELNKLASKLNFLCFPILILYTVRDDYYRDWESDFEGRHEVIQKRKSITSFTDDEFYIAIKKYEEVYNYKIVNELSKESRDILSIPINLEIYSDANEYEGDVIVNEIWEGKILQSYFDRKLDDIDKHFIHGVTKEIYLNILSSLAYKIVELNEISFDKSVYKKLIIKDFITIESLLEQIFHLFESEQIIIKDIEKDDKYRFRYLRFMEYLVAYYSVSNVNKNKEIEWLNTFTQTIFDSGFISMFRVFDNIKSITNSQFKPLKSHFDDYFQKSENFMSKKLPLIRANIANGNITCKEDLKMIFDNSFSNNPQLTWDAFFVVAAKPNNISSQVIVDTFEHTWTSNLFNKNRWRLLVGISKNNLLLNERVIKIMLNSENSKDWEVYLGYLLENKMTYQFNDLDVNSLFEKKIQEFTNNNISEWNYVEKLYQIVKHNETHLPDNITNIIKNVNSNADFQNKKELEISADKKNEFIKIIDEIEINYMKGLKTGFYKPYFTPFMDNEMKFFNKLFNKKFNKPYGKDKKPFVNYLVANGQQYSVFLSFLIENPLIDCNLLGFDSHKTTLFQEILHSSFHNKFLLFEYLVLKKYPQRKIDSDFLVSEEKQNPFNEYVYLGKFYFSLSNYQIVKKINNNERIICTLLSFKYNRVIGFKFSNLISVANNALSHYQSHYKLIIKAVKYYNLYEVLSSKISFSKKEQELFLKDIINDHSSDDLFNELFPELFSND